MGRIFSWFWDEGFWVENPWKWKDQVRGDDLLFTGLAFWNNAHDHGSSGEEENGLRKVKQNLHGKSIYKNFTEIYHDVLIALGFERLKYNNANDAVLMANLGRFNVLLTDYETANRIGGRRPKWDKDLKGLCWFMNSHAVRSYEEQPSDDIRGVDAIQVMTIHQAKGLEWPIVFLFALVNDRFPPKMLGRRQNWCDIPREMFDAERYEGDIEDEGRLFYVAITRARDALILSHFRKLNNRKRRRSAFLDKLDKNVVKNLVGRENIPTIRIDPLLRPDEIQTFSASEIIDYKMCPYMYLLRDIWGYQPGLNQAIGFGKSLHYCLRRAAERVKQDGLGPMDAVIRSCVEDFHIPFAGGEVFENFKNGAKKILVNYAKVYADDIRSIEEVEYRLEYPVKNATIMGKVDAITNNEGDLEIREYKTSEEARTFDETAFQVKLYAAGLKALGRAVKHGSIVYLEKPEIKPMELPDSDLEEAAKSAESTIDGIVKRLFEPFEGENCRRCDYQPICGRAIDAVWQTSFSKIRFCIIDFETTGSDPDTDEVIEVGAVEVKDYKIGKFFHTLIQPNKPVSTKIAKITGLNMDILMGEPTVDEVKPDLERFIKGSVLVEHSRGMFDLSFLKKFFGITRRQHHLNTYDMSRLLFPDEEKHDLESLCKRFNIQLKKHHHALDDAKATANVLIKFLELLERNGVMCLNDLKRMRCNVRWS
jgi:DNA helicase-2/ATP-dependent DNA helicase PcrA